MIGGIDTLRAALIMEELFQAGLPHDNIELFELDDRILIIPNDACAIVDMKMLCDRGAIHSIGRSFKQGVFELKFDRYRPLPP